jgi:hypothetical protein
MLLHYLDLVERFEDVIVLQSVLSAVKDASLVAYRKVVERTKANAGVYLYYNDFARQTATQRVADESELQYLVRRLVLATAYLSDHFAQVAPVFLLTENEDVRATAVNFGVNAMTADEFVNEL